MVRVGQVRLVGKRTRGKGRARAGGSPGRRAKGSFAEPFLPTSKRPRGLRRASLLSRRVPTAGCRSASALRERGCCGAVGSTTSSARGRGLDGRKSEPQAERIQSEGTLFWCERAAARDQGYEAADVAMVTVFELRARRELPLLSRPCGLAHAARVERGRAYSLSLNGSVFLGLTWAHGWPFGSLASRAGGRAAPSCVSRRGAGERGTSGGAARLNARDVQRQDAVVLVDELADIDRGHARAPE